jgi:nicotinamidase-related amidase
MNLSKPIHLLAIDVQNDFCHPNGSLYVKGANEDAKRLANFVTKMGDKIKGITTTIDNHHPLHIAHAIMWINKDNKHPDIFTTITKEDVVNGIWKASIPEYQTIQEGYVTLLEEHNKNPLCIWPQHCLISSWGCNLEINFHNAIVDWQNNNKKMVKYINKGSKIFTEHYSAFEPEIDYNNYAYLRIPITGFSIDAKDPLVAISKFEAFDGNIVIAGEALSHCVKATTLSILKWILKEENISKFIILEDCCSNVTGFEHYGEEFLKEVVSKGMKIAKSTDF